VAQALCDLVAGVGYDAVLPFVRFSQPYNPEGIVASVLQGLVPKVSPAALIPISGAKHECGQLRYNRPVPKCANGSDCEGAKLPGAPGPLCVYCTPAEANAGVHPPAPAFCLLCIRHDAAALVKTLSVVSSSSQGLYGAAVALPPFQNTVNQVDGYKSQYLGVSPIHSFVFTPISIVGPCPVKVEYDEEQGGFYVDQSEAIYFEDRLNGEAPSCQGGQSLSAFSM